MHTIWKAGTVAAVAAVVGAFFVGRVVADQPPLPDVGGAVIISPSAAPTPAGDPSALRPGTGPTAGDRGRPGADNGARGDGDGDRGGADDDSGPGDADDGARVMMTTTAATAGDGAADAAATGTATSAPSAPPPSRSTNATTAGTTTVATTTEPWGDGC